MADSVTEIRDDGPDLRDVLDQYDNEEENLAGQLALLTSQVNILILKILHL